jgi:hypothetical protein
MATIGVLIPDRNDRPQFLEHLFKMLEGQTMQPNFIELVNFPATSEAPDLTKRVRIGFETLKAKGCDCVLIMENDDWYSCHYIERMVNGWLNFNRPDLFGIDYTYYYHIFKNQYRLLKHPNRASLMNTLISCAITPNWCNDSEVYLDLHLWKKHKGTTFTPSQTKPIAIGIKHGIGKCGGNGHEGMIYNYNDNYLDILRNFTDLDSLEFYTKLKSQNQ